MLLKKYKVRLLPNYLVKLRRDLYRSSLNSDFCEGCDFLLPDYCDNLRISCKIISSIKDNVCIKNYWDHTHNKGKYVYHVVMYSRLYT